MEQGHVMREWSARPGNGRVKSVGRRCHGWCSEPGGSRGAEHFEKVSLVYVRSVRRSVIGCFRSVMSWASPAMRYTWPCVSHIGKARSQIQRMVPSGRTIRYSILYFPVACFVMASRRTCARSSGWIASTQDRGALFNVAQDLPQMDSYPGLI